MTAIDIALEPDAMMIEHAMAANARLLKAFPKGFALDATHHPHVSMLQQFVRTALTGSARCGASPHRLAPPAHDEATFLVAAFMNVLVLARRRGACARYCAMLRGGQAAALHS